MGALDTINRSGVEGIQAVMSQVNTVAQQMGRAVQELRSLMDAPREIVRGPDGKAAGVRINGAVRPINRGPDGRATGIQ